MTLLHRALPFLACIALVAPTVAQTVPQTPITVQVINDSGLPDAAINLLLVGQDVGNTPAGAVGTFYPFSVSGVRSAPTGLTSSSSSIVSTQAGTTSAGTAPIYVTANASPMTMAFVPPTLAVGGTSVLTIALPNAGAAVATVAQPFTSTMPTGVTISSPALGGSCPNPSNLLTMSATQITAANGYVIPAGGCTIVVTITSTTVGTVYSWTSYLQTIAGNVPPTTAPLSVVASTQGVTAAFNPSTIAVGTGNNTTLTVTIPNAGNPTTLTAAFTYPMPTAMQILPGTSTNTCSGSSLAVTTTQISLPSGTYIPSGGCTFTVSATSIATAGALTQMTNTGTTVTSPYTGLSLPVYSFTMATVSSGTLYASYNAPISYPSAPSVRTPIRFQPMEFSYSNAIASNGDLTSIDFFGIPLELQTFAPTDTALVYPLDRVTYYTSTTSLLNAFTKVDANLQYAFMRTDGMPFDPANPLTNFARIVGPNQVAAGGTPALINYPANAPANWVGTWPPSATSGSPWPYSSFADYLDSLVNASPAYTFTESDTGVISAYTFSYTGAVTGNRNSGYTITLTSNLPVIANTPPALSTNETITLSLPAGAVDFGVYGVPQNCTTIAVANFTCVPATAYIPAIPAIPAQGGHPAVPAVPAVPANPGNVTTITNSVYGWIQADVISALNFGYMNGKADAENGGGQSSVWYGIPPVQFPFGLARPTKANNFTDDGYYNAWAALMYNHSDAYGFAYSDRKGRPSPDISFPIGGTLRVWILPDQRLDTPMATVTASDSTSITLQWPAVNNATSYTLTWSPPYQTASMQVPPPNSDPNTVIQTITGLTPGTPYTITVQAVGINAATQAPIQSFEVPVYARTHGTAPAAPAGDVQFQFGFNWAPPGYMTTGGPSTWPTVSIAGQTGTFVSGTKFTIPLTTGINVGPPPASAALTTASNGTSPSLYITESISAATSATPGMPPYSAVMTVVLGNNTSGAVSMAGGLTITMPPGVEASQTTAQSTLTTCEGAVALASGTNTPSTVVMGGAAIPDGGCTIVVSLTSSTPGTVLITVPAMIVAGVQSSLPANAPLIIPGANTVVTQSITPTTINPGTPAQLTIALANTSGTTATLVESFVTNMPSGVSLVNATTGSTGTCAAVTTTLQQIVMPTGATIPATGCTIVVNITSNTPGTTTVTTGAVLTGYPTQAFPLEVKYGGNTIWSANFYLTMMGTPTSYSVGICHTADNCAGSGLQNQVNFDTLLAPNFLERQGVGLAVSGGQSISGPPFGAVSFLPTIGVSLTPVANKKTTKVRMAN
ncbi:MAG: fibronectin type III domain-containing protein [Betaproteobacteria bacterium]